MWTPSALAPELRPYRGVLWRFVEGQHRISTNRLARSAADQRIIEDLVDEVKPDLPAGAERLHFLLFTPFRYGHRIESRFRRAHERPGIFYAAEAEGTALAESAYGRLLFFSRSPSARLPRSVVEHTAFTIETAVQRGLDLTLPPFDRDRALWTHPTDYTACQTLAGAARSATAQSIRYASVRDPATGTNVALLDPAAFRTRQPKIRRTWHYKFEGEQLTALAAFPSTERHAFTAAQFGLG